MIKADKISKNKDRLAWEIADCLRDDSNLDRNIILFGYVLWKAKEYGLAKAEDAMRYVEIQIKATIEKIGIDEATWNKLSKLLKVASSEDFKRIVMEYQGFMSLSTPRSVSKLALEILDFQANEDVVDLGCGFGDFFSMAASKLAYPVLMTGYEIDEDIAAVTAARGNIGKFNVKIADIYTLLETGNRNRFQKGFAVLNWGRKAGMMTGPAGWFVDSLNEGYINPIFQKGTSGEWVQAKLMIELLRDNGKAAIVMTMGALTNGQDNSARQYFVKNKYIEAVVALPEKMFAPYSSISTAMVILSRDNESIRMVDATDIFTKGRKCNEFSDTDLAEVLDRMRHDSGHSVTVTCKDYGNCPLNPIRYLVNQNSITDGIRFGDIILDAKRGAQMAARKLDEVNSVEPTSIRYLKVNNIQGGTVSGELSYIKEGTGLDRYYINNDEIVLSKVAGLGKAAIVRKPAGENWVLGANLYSMNINKEKAEPLYVKLFLESEKGTELLKSIASGITVPMISIEELRDMRLPLPPIEDQRNAIVAYKEAEAEVERLRFEYETAYNKLKNIIKF